MDFSWLSDPTALVALATLVVMEVVLGIDNLIFISILTNKLPEHQRSKARRIGIGLALILRLGLLGTIAIIVTLTEPIFTVFGHAFSWRDLILIGGGLFLVWKATKEIHHSVDPTPSDDVFDTTKATMTFGAAITQILLLDLVFSLDSIITAVGMTDIVMIMVIAVVTAVTVMLLAANPLANFIQQQPDRCDAGARLPDDDRHDADRGRLRSARAEGLHLCGHGVFSPDRGAQHALQAGRPAQGRNSSTRCKTLRSHAGRLRWPLPPFSPIFERNSLNASSELPLRCHLSLPAPFRVRRPLPWLRPTVLIAARTWSPASHIAWGSMAMCRRTARQGRCRRSGW